MPSASQCDDCRCCRAEDGCETAQAFIEPDLKTAHLKIYNTFNPFSGFMNATYILKSAKAVTKQQIKAVLQV